jgi:hypothetical protein
MPASTEPLLLDRSVVESLETELDLLDLEESRRTEWVVSMLSTINSQT